MPSAYLAARRRRVAACCRVNAVGVLVVAAGCVEFGLEPEVAALDVVGADFNLVLRGGAVVGRRSARQRSRRQRSECRQDGEQNHSFVQLSFPFFDPWNPGKSGRSGP